jgi:hypothetical protein
MDTEQFGRLYTAAIPFVMARCKKGGGFGATPRLPATIQDTYHALNILSLSRRQVPPTGSESNSLAEDSLRAYLAKSLRLLSSTGIGTAFQLLWSCRAAGVAFDHGAVATAVKAKVQGSASLEDWYFFARIQREILGNKHLVAAEGQGIGTILSRGWRCVVQAWMQIYLAQAYASPLPRPGPELVAWFQACQNGDGGFGFFPGTTSFIENCHACLRALVLLGSEPLDPGRALSFLSGCRTASGGFSRGGRAAPFLDATWHALASLSLAGASLHEGPGTK